MKVWHLVSVPSRVIQHELAHGIICHVTQIKANVLPMAGPPPLQPSTLALAAPSTSDPTFAIPPA